MNNNRKIALVLGGGSARGLAHIGALKVLQRYNIPVDMIVGTSIGSLIGATYALDIPIARTEERALKVTWWQLADFVISKIGFLEGRNLERIIRESIEDKSFSDLKIPLAVVTTDIENGEEVIITEGDLCTAIRASCSLPGIFMPVRIGERLLVDGMLKQSVPSDVAKRMGATFIIAVDVGFCIRRDRVTNIFQSIFQTMQIIGNELNKYQSKVADAIIKVHLGEDIDQMAFDKAAQIIAEGEAAANDTIPMLLKQMKEAGLIQGDI